MEKILRPHHGMCFQFYEGTGYSEDFTDHMGRIIHEMEEDPNQLITIKADVDMVCANCPNNEAGTCSTQGKVLRYDNGVLQACGIGDGTQMTYAQFISLVKTNIIDTGLRTKICGDCGWDYICGRSSSSKL